LLDQLGILLQLFKRLETALWSIVPPLRPRLRAAPSAARQLQPPMIARCNPWTVAS